MKSPIHLRCAGKLSLGMTLAVILHWMPPVAANAFTVTKDVNHAKIEEKVIFQKGTPADQLEFVDKDNCKFSVTPDGSLDCAISGSAEVKAIVKWKPASGLPATLSCKDYDCLIITCRVEGGNLTTDKKGNVMTDKNGNVVHQRVGNMWLPIVVFDAQNELIGSANLADGAPDGNTPEKTITMKFPMSVITFWGPGGGDIAGIGFTWGAARTNRDYHIVIDKIALGKIVSH